ncbi:MAG: hypothetical protein O3B24_07695 [Verrucomicrobia bacterium]|nr:hypothetical protein [Verrucomicrobiota bacterium]
MGDAVALMLEPPAFPDSPLRGGERVRFDAGTALLVPAPELATTRDLLKRHGLAMHEWAIGPWVLLQLPSSATVPRIMPPLVWTGYGLRAGAHRDYAFALLADAAARQATAADVHSVLEDMELAVRAYPGMIAAAGDVLPSLERHAPGPRTAALMDAYRRLTQPPVPTAARFAGDIALLGLDVRTPVVHPGGQAEVVYYWRSAAGPDAARWSVFAHFRQAEKRFQDDRLFAAPQVVLQREVGAEKEVFQEVRRFTIPEDAAEGEWELLVGLYDGRGHRARATGYGKFRARGLRLPAVIRVQVETNAVPETSRP